MPAAKVALVEPEGTITEVGTLTALLLLARLTDNPEVGAGALTVTEQVSLPAPTIVDVEQLRPESEAMVPAWPRNVIHPAVLLVDDLAIALTLSCAVTLVADVGSKPTCTTMVPPAGRVTGKEPAVTVNALDELLS